MEISTYFSDLKVGEVKEYKGRNQNGEIGATILKYPPVPETGEQMALIKTYEDVEPKIGRVHRELKFKGIEGQFGIEEASIMSATFERITKQYLTMDKENAGQVVLDTIRILESLQKLDN